MKKPARRRASRVQRNPALAIFGNPRGGSVVSDDVKAIVYRHKETGELMVHAFGPSGESIVPALRGSTLTIRHMPRGRSGTKAIALPDGRWLFEHEHGLRLWEHFD